MALITASKSRGLTRILTVKDANGDAISPGANDKLRVIIGRDRATAMLTLVSGTNSAAGSSITKNTPTGKNTLRLDATDLDFEPGVYTFYFDYFDNADAQEWKKIEDQVFVLMEN